MSELELACPLHVQAARLSALYDDDLADETAVALREHIADCDACQTRLSEYARMRVVLLRQVVPQPDARLMRGVLAARAHASRSARRRGWAAAAWRSVAAAAAIILIIGGFAGVLLREAASRGSGSDSMLARTPVASAVTAPPGWRMLTPTPGYSMDGELGLAVSAARPGRLVGCAIKGPVGAVSSDVVLELSDDGGKTWQASAIPDLPPTSDCFVIVDQDHPDTIIVGGASNAYDSGTDTGGQLVVTTDAGRTWRSLPEPPDGPMELNGYFTPTLINGQLIGVVDLAPAGARALGDLSIAGQFTYLDSSLPYPNASPSLAAPLAFAVDPTNPSHLYVAAASKPDAAHPTASALLFTLTGAGATWRQIHTFAGVEQMQLWAPTPGALYALPSGGGALQQSADGGLTWRSITPAGFHVSEAWFGPSGQIVLSGGVAHGQTNALFALDAATSTLTPMNPVPDKLVSDYLAMVTGGSDPLFIAADYYTTYAQPLP